MSLNILSAGAAQGVVLALAAQLKAETGAELNATFGAVGAMREKFLAGDACDLIILTQAQIAELVAQSRVWGDSVGDLGIVCTGVAVRVGDALPDVSSADALRVALLAADGIYFPDPVKATAGIHVAKMIAALGIEADVATRLRTYPNGATAMRAMADEKSGRVIGLTQATEINYTVGAVWVAALPKPYELTTVYSVGVTASAASEKSARHLARMLTTESSRALRETAGYAV